MRKSNEFKILKIKLNAVESIKKKKIHGVEKVAGEESDEGWETISEHSDEDERVQTNSNLIRKKLDKEMKEESDEEYGPVALPNGELLLENGTIIGNKIYQIYYKQRVRINRLEGLIASRKKEQMRLKIRNVKELKQQNKKIKYFSIRDSNKSSFTRVNTLFKARKQVNV